MDVARVQIGDLRGSWGTISAAGTEFFYFCLSLINDNELLFTPFHVSDDWSGFAARVLLGGQMLDRGSQKRQWRLLRRL